MIYEKLTAKKKQTYSTYFLKLIKNCSFLFWKIYYTGNKYYKK